MAQEHRPAPLTDADKAYYASVLRAEVQRPEQRLDLAYETEETDENAKTQTS